MAVVPGVLHIIRSDVLLWCLGGFAETEPSPREQLIERLKELLASDLSYREIGERVGKSEQIVAWWRWHLGLEKHHAGRRARLP